MECYGAEAEGWVCWVGGVGSVCVVEWLEGCGEAEPEGACDSLVGNLSYGVGDYIPKLPKTTNGNVLPTRNSPRAPRIMRRPPKK